jgi:uncharacterized protein with GYD domain
LKNTQLYKEGEIKTIFVSLAKWRKKPTKEMIAEMDRNWDHLKREGGSLLQAYWTFGRFDAVVILEAPNEKTALKALMRGGDHLSIETLLAIPRAEAVKLLD